MTQTAPDAVYTPTTTAPRVIENPHPGVCLEGEVIGPDVEIEALANAFMLRNRLRGRDPEDLPVANYKGHAFLLHESFENFAERHAQSRPANVTWLHIEGILYRKVMFLYGRCKNNGEVDLKNSWGYI
jgi:hypothetical protein